MSRVQRGGCDARLAVVAKTSQLLLRSGSRATNLSVSTFWMMPRALNAFDTGLRLVLNILIPSRLVGDLRLDELNKEVGKLRASGKLLILICKRLEFVNFSRRAARTLPA